VPSEGDEIDHVAQMAASLDAVAVPLGMERMDMLGEDDSGAGHLYAVRLRRGTIFADYDVPLARALLAWPQAPRVAHEVGGGFGNLSILLAALGFETISLDLDRKRSDGAEALLAGLKAVFPGLRERCRMINARFPMWEGELPSAGAMVLITNLFFATTAQAKARILAALKTYAFAVIDVDRFLIHCKTPEERAGQLEAFRDAGLVGELFLDLGASACFYRFSGD
jgi:hypothetical protein